MSNPPLMRAISKDPVLSKVCHRVGWRQAGEGGWGLHQHTCRMRVRRCENCCRSTAVHALPSPALPCTVTNLVLAEASRTMHLTCCHPACLCL